MSEEERNEFTKLKHIKVVFDIGARDTEYPEIKPRAEYHLFEPNKEFYDKLVEKYKGKKNIYINNFALGDKEKNVPYLVNSQSFIGSDCTPTGSSELLYPMKKLDKYIEENNIKRIDFLKVDTEGYDFKILESSPKAVSLAKYIQYETWNDPYCFINLLSDEFELKDIGQRNILCKRKH